MRDEDKIRELVSMVAHRYNESSSCLEILELQDGRFVMQLRSDFVPEVKKLATKKLLTIGPLRTLSFIAARQPITQSHVVRVRGKLAYKHIKQLQDLQLISKSNLGRTCILKTTESFCDYFNLSHDARLMKKQLDRLFSELNTQQERVQKNTGADK
jgi:segregation and condensation protein B